MTGLPTGLSYNATTKKVSGTVANDAEVKDYTATITASDSDTNTTDATATFTVAVTDKNFPPVITDPGDKSFAQGAAITTFAISVSDADQRHPHRDGDGPAFWAVVCQRPGVWHRVPDGSGTGTTRQRSRRTTAPTRR